MEYDKESLEQIANLEVVDIETGIDYHNRVRLRLENGVCILADIVNIQTPEERLIELNEEAEKLRGKLADIELKSNVIQAYAVLVPDCDNGDCTI